ncbi:hypothetical protein JXB31_03165 [Candidatus Woesearchaeota archaeon]|nr:hypothetical protein [Candidatus Woesearchaeota archaeon]
MKKVIKSNLISNSNMTLFMLCMISMALVMSIMPAALAEEGSDSEDIELDQATLDEIAELESVSDAEELEDIMEDVDETELDEDAISKRLKMKDSELEKYKKARQSIGEKQYKQYILNKQLRQRIMVAGIVSDAIIKHVENSGADTSELEEIQEKIEEIGSSIEEENMTIEQFIAKLGEVKALTRQFKEKVHELVPEEELDELEQEIEQEKEQHREKIKEAENNANHARELYNTLQLNKGLDKINKEIVAMKHNNTKLLALAERFHALHQLKAQFLGQNATKENVLQFREQWKERLQEYKDERFETKLKNERVELATEAKHIIEAIKEARANGEETSDLVSQLKELRSAIKGINSNKVNESSMSAKAAEIRSMIRNMNEDKKISEMIERIREQHADRINELKNRLEQIRNSNSADGNNNVSSDDNSPGNSSAPEDGNKKNGGAAE